MNKTEARALFVKERARMAKSFSWVASAKLLFVDGDCPQSVTCAKRDFATTQIATSEIRIATRALALPKANVRGLILHELGHVADLNIRESGAEQRADDLVEYATGVLVRYDRADIQTTAKSGVYPRPKHLHR